MSIILISRDKSLLSLASSPYNKKFLTTNMFTYLYIICMYKSICYKIYIKYKILKEKLNKDGNESSNVFLSHYTGSFYISSG